MKRSVPELCSNTDGAVAPTVALSLLALIAIGGVGFDYARLANMDTELQNAADQATLAAAAQLDRKSGACARAAAAASGMVRNETMFAKKTANDGLDVTIFQSGVDDTTCDSTGNVRFWQDKAKTTAADSDLNAKFVEVQVNSRVAAYALTPIVAVFQSGAISAVAFAGVGSSICKVPPLMICNPAGTQAFVPTPGVGIKVVAHQNGQSWSPGDFGFLNVGQANNGAPDLLAAMAYQNASLTCQSIDTGDVDTGATVPAIDAANTRFDIYNFGGGSGSTLGACLSSGYCPAALNVVKDLVRDQAASGNNACKIHGNGWHLPTNQFRPVQTAGTDAMRSFQDPAQSTIDAMGLPRDNCHYTSYGSACTDGRIGDGKWARGDYFDKYHPSTRPTNVSTITRYQAYLWEIQQNTIPNGVSAGGGDRQYGQPVCSSGALDPTRDRRVFTVAIASNCPSLSGSSVPVQISKWVDMFFVEPGASGRGNGVTNDEIYLEAIREVQTAGDGTNAQLIRRDLPYLIE